MVNRKLSGINDMKNYDYKIKNLEIIEYDQWGYKECSWDLIDFSKESSKFKSDWHKKSFFRTREWLMENHSELMI